MNTCQILMLMIDRYSGRSEGCSRLEVLASRCAKAAHDVEVKHGQSLDVETGVSLDVLWVHAAEMSMYLR